MVGNMYVGCPLQVGHSHLAARNVDPGSKPSSGFLGVIALLYGASDADQGGESSTFLPV